MLFKITKCIIFYCLKTLTCYAKKYIKDSGEINWISKDLNIYLYS